LLRRVTFSIAHEWEDRADKKQNPRNRRGKKKEEDKLEERDKHTKRLWEGEIITPPPWVGVDA